MSITLLIRDTKWRRLRGLGARLKRAAGEALVRGGGQATAAITILLTSDRHMSALNLGFRGKDEPTNVLSFPSSMSAYLGDIAIAYGVTAKEAKNAGKSHIDHTTHLAVHGVLHLLGYDHATARQAKIMEPLEIGVLKALNVADPYGREAARRP
ncbi:MAG: rRNA maturation RNase YbeY [Alphaproteobacteria bacterium]|nr:rRNA maturation RNase YbeY [Alphaproteobacteria bacterium]